MEAQKNEESILDIAQNCVHTLKARHPNCSSAQIASNIGMEQSTFSRIENGQTKSPNLNSVIKLLLASGMSFKLTKVIEKLNPSLAQVLEKNMSHNAENPFIGSELSHYLKMPVYRNVILLASSRSGTTRKEIEQECGELGLQKLDELLKKGIFQESEEAGIRATEKGVRVTFDQDTLTELLINCIQDYYASKDFALSKNWLSIQTESVNKDKVLGLIRSKMQRVYNEVEEMIRLPEYQGNDKIFVGMVTDSITKKSNNNLEEKGVLQ